MAKAIAEAHRDTGGAGSLLANGIQGLITSKVDRLSQNAQAILKVPTIN